ncbi:MAG: glycosyltransferase, partial [Gemmatimonadota bacterium]
MTPDDAAAAGEVRVVIAGGGTGGHLTPALALARELTRRSQPVVNVTLVGGWRGQDREVLGGSGLPHRLLSAPALERRRWWRNVLLPPRLVTAYGAARGIVREVDPHV